MRNRKVGPYSEIDANHKITTVDACYSRKTWPALLASHMNIDYICYAKAGCSNQTIVRKFFQYYDNIEKNDFIVINWTWIDRWDFIDSSEILEKNMWKTLLPNDTQYTEINKLYFKYLQSELWNKLESLKSIAFIINTLINKNIKFIMTCVDDLILDQHYHSPSYIKNLQQIIEPHLIWFDDAGFYEWSINNEFSRGKQNDHPLEEAHIAAFKYIINNHNHKI